MDGVTIVVLAAEKVQYETRTQGIDVPECGQALGTESKEHLTELLAGQNIVVD